MDTAEKSDIRKLSREALRTFFTENGAQAFRGNQVYEWLWQKGAHSFEAMTDLSLAHRELLNTHFTINHIAVDQMQRSTDGTIKNAVRARRTDRGIRSDSHGKPDNRLCIQSGGLQPGLSLLRYGPAQTHAKPESG